MTRVRYPGHLLTTRRQALWQGVAILAVLVPLLVWRISTESRVIAMVLAALMFGVFASAYRAWRFLERQEQQHQQATAEMTFVFEHITTVPLVMGSFLMILMFELGR